MKIKTITCHQVYNYGASLQELALVEFLKINGHDAESIAYKPSYLADVHKLIVWSKFVKSAVLVVVTQAISSASKSNGRYKGFILLTVFRA